SLTVSNQLEITADVEAVPRWDLVLLERLLRHGFVLHEDLAVRLAHEAALRGAVDHLRRRRPLARVDAGRRDVPCVAGGRRRRLAAHVRVVSLTGLGSGARLVARAARVAATALALGARSRALPGDPGDLRQRDDLDAGHRAPASGLAGLLTPTTALTARPPREPRDLSLALDAALTLAPDDLFEVAEPLQELPLLLLAQRLLRHALHVLGAALDVLGALAECFL